MFAQHFSGKHFFLCDRSEKALVMCAVFPSPFVLGTKKCLLGWGEEGRGNEDCMFAVLSVESGISQFILLLKWRWEYRSVAFKYKMYWSWEDLNFVGRKALKRWPGHTFESSVGTDVTDTSYVPLLQTNGDGERRKKTLQFAWMVPRTNYRIGERDCALQPIRGLAKPRSAGLRPVIWLAHFCRAHQVQTLLPSWDGAAGIWFPPWMGEEESCAVFSPRWLHFLWPCCTLPH